MGTIADVFNGLSRIVGFIDSKTKKMQDDKIARTKAVRTAINETEIYLGTYKIENQRSHGVERKLSRAWSEVAIIIAPADAELSDACRFLSQFWSGIYGDSEMEIKKVIRVMETILARGRSGGTFHYFE